MRGTTNHKQVEGSLEMVRCLNYTTVHFPPIRLVWVGFQWNAMGVVEGEGGGGKPSRGRYIPQFASWRWPRLTREAFANSLMEVTALWIC